MARPIANAEGGINLEPHTTYMVIEQTHPVYTITDGLAYQMFTTTETAQIIRMWYLSTEWSIDHHDNLAEHAVPQFMEMNLNNLKPESWVLISKAADACYDRVISCPPVLWGERLEGPLMERTMMNQLSCDKLYLLLRMLKVDRVLVPGYDIHEQMMDFRAQAVRGLNAGLGFRFHTPKTIPRR